MEPEHSVSEQTRQAAEVDASMPHQPDREPTEEEARLADDRMSSAEERAEVARHHEEMDRLGAEVRGEGQIT